MAVAHNPIHYSSESDKWYIFDLKNNTNCFDLEELVRISEEAEMLSIRAAATLRMYS